MEKKLAPQLTEDEMIEIIEKFKASGLTRRQFCLDNNYPMSNFYYWQKKYHQKFPLTEEQMKSRPGRKPKGMIVTEDGTVIVPSKPGKKTTKKKTTRSKTAKKAKATSATSKKRGRPSLAKIEPEVPAVQEVAAVINETAAKKVKADKKAKTTRKVAAAPTAPMANGPVMMIKYPNGTKLLVSADISLDKLKEMINL